MEPEIITQRIIGLALIAVIGLAIAAWAYDRWITDIEAHGHHRGYMALLVAAGVAIVLLAGLIVVWPLGPLARLAIAIQAGLFVPAGLPMTIGSIRRHIIARSAEEAAIITNAREQIQ